MKLKTEWVNALAVCKSFGMDIISFESKTESEKMLDICSRNADLFEVHTYAGGLAANAFSLDEWYWMNSGKRLNFKLRFAPGEPNNHLGSEFCLSIVRWEGTTTFYFNDIDCSNDARPFLCQKLI